MPAKLVLFRPTLGQGGADRVTVTLLQAFDRTLFEPVLVLVKREGDYLFDVPMDVRLHVLDARRLADAWLPLAKFLQRENPDILFSTASGANSIAVLAHKLARQKGRLVLSERNVLLHGQITFKKKLLLILKRFVYRFADHITAVSEGVHDDLVMHLRVPSEKISVVYNPIITDDLHLLEKEPINYLWFQENIPIVLAAGRLVAEKDFGTLIQAFARVHANQKARLVILGEGHLRAELETLIRQLGLARDVALPGFDKNPFKYMARCNVFVLSSRFEGLPGVLIQAMACRAPVISTDCPSGPSEIITSNMDGILVPIGDVEAMAEQISFLLDHSEQAHEMGKRAEQSAQRFRVERVMERYTTALLGHT